MSLDKINLGFEPNDGTGDTLRGAGQKINKAIEFLNGSLRQWKPEEYLDEDKAPFYRVYNGVLFIYVGFLPTTTKVGEAPDLSGNWEKIGFVGVDGEGKIKLSFLPQLPISQVDGLLSTLGLYLKLSGGTVNGDMVFDGESTFNGTVKFDDDVEVYGSFSTDAEAFLRDNVFCEHSIQVEKSIVIDKNKSLTGIANSIFTVKKDSTVPGIDVGAFIDINRNISTNATSDCYGSVVRLKNASNFDSKGLIAANYVANHVGGGNADYLCGSLFKSAYNGSGNIGFILPTSHKLEIKGTGVGVIDYARGLSPHVLIDNPNVIVNHAQGLHPTVKFVNGTVKDSHVLYLDVDYDTNGIAKIIGDFAYIQAGNDQLPAVEGTAHFIKSQCKLPSLFSGLIEMDVDAIDIVNGSEKTLVNKEFLTTELSKVNKQIKVYENSRDITSALLNRDRPDAQIGDIVTNKAKPELYQKITENQWVKYQGVLI
ncbi:hypothetical protein T190115A13A_210019 [Tenacibaculum sp. 190524A02b]|uniref:Uncharacterized protein n=1 Tax=Tenacibaculum vairaonense TaxID=3137860 RepID=A0ABM9PL23_9FLAO